MNAPRCCGIAAGDGQVATGDGARHQERACLDAIGIDAIACAVQAGDALHADGGCSGAFDLCAHGDQQSGQVGHFRLARAVLHDGFAFGKHRGHEQIFRAGDGDLVEDDVRAFESSARGLEIAVLLHDGGAHLLQALDVQIDGAATDGAASGHCDASHPGARDQGPSTSELARMVFTISYLATGSERCGN